MEATSVKSLSQEILHQYHQSVFPVAQPERAKAISDFQSLGLPSNKTEEYRFTPIAQQLEKAFEWNTVTKKSTVESVEKFLIPNVKANVVTFVNGTYSEKLSSIISSAAQVKIGKLSEALSENNGLAKNYFNKLQPAQTDSFAALNTALWSEGVFIHVTENADLDFPILILHLFDTSADQVISHTRALVVVEKNAKVNLIEKFDTLGTHNSFHNLTEEILVKENAELEYCRIQNDGGKNYQITNTLIHQSDSSKLNTFTLTLKGELIRNNFGIIIDGEKCESHFYGLYLLDGNTLADNHTVVDHRKPNSFSNEMYKGVMDGKSKGIFNGKIFVRPHAQKTNAFQSNRNILMTDTTTVHTKPQLEIWADDVKCSHGCTSGQLDEEALFYLQSRGIAKDTARAMLLYAFASEVMEPVKNNGLKAYLDNLIAERLHKSF